ncbi:helix-turn-helix transcriptional regulator [Aurantiacibacter gilvus]|uniref:LuxR C-terminal-related transcriptional regulator n=1 Tax=Aurantiacibacter gilvus TaxID=3139141 RepID=A0ABU9IB38_9SPHN
MHALGLLDIEAAFFLAPLTPDPRVGRVLLTMGMSSVWERHYRARLYLIDPLPRIALETPLAFCWPRDVDMDGLNDSERRYLAIAEQHGLASGIGTVGYGPSGRMGFLAGIWSKPEPPSDETLMAVHQIGQVSFVRYCQIVRDDFEVPPLSNRELEVLEWMCRGKSNPVIAEIMGVSRSSIDTYIRRIFAKLDVTDRTAACMRAYSRGLVVTDEVERRVERAKRIGLGPRED